MCGLTGFLAPIHNRTSEKLQSIAERMTDTLYHRGPDDGDVWVDAAVGIGIGHRRLSILDLSPSGHQPMHSPSGRYVIVFNGEIYNHCDIRKELEGNSQINWRGHSDTEVMLAAIEEWGLESSVRRFVGMFAFALWDRKERALHLVRDRLGEKPLYYGWMENVFLFGSELKALRAHPAFKGEINRDALALYLRHSYVPAPYSIYKGIYKLPPGTILTMHNTETASLSRPVPYWSFKEVIENGISDPFKGSENEAIDNLHMLLLSAMELQMMADVPVGAFLSGGIDSSTVVALMQSLSSKPVKTFTIGFHEAGYNEAADAKEVARHLRTDHTELYVTPQQAMDVIPRLPVLYDEPFAAPSQIPTFLIAELARRHVIVSLSGDGGDELFAGYNRYLWGQDIWRKTSFLPGWLKRSLATPLTALSPLTWDKLFWTLRPVLPKRVQYQSPGDKLQKLAGILNANSKESLYLDLISHWKSPTSVVLGGSELLFRTDSQWPQLPDFAQQMMYLDTISYLPDEVLAKVDRATMGVSLEARVPMLDHRVVEFAWKVPLSMKIRDGQGKWLLRQVLYKYVPQQLIERPKKGFSVPIDSWLRGPLRDWAEELLNENRLRQEGFFDPAPIREKWAEHLSGKRNWQYLLWDVLMFQAWLQENKGN